MTVKKMALICATAILSFSSFGMNTQNHQYYIQQFNLSDVIDYFHEHINNNQNKDIQNYIIFHSKKIKEHYNDFNEFLWENYADDSHDNVYENDIASLPTPPVFSKESRITTFRQNIYNDILKALAPFYQEVSNDDIANLENFCNNF